MFVAATDQWLEAVTTLADASHEEAGRLRERQPQPYAVVRAGLAASIAEVVDALAQTRPGPQAQQWRTVYEGLEALDRLLESLA